MNKSTGYRAFPKEISNPKTVKRVSKEEVLALGAQKIQEAPSICEGHEGTIIWYVDKCGYFVEVKLKGKPSICMESICTFTPTFGMDSIDGIFAQDVEEYILSQELGFQTGRLDIFQGRQSVYFEEYLRDRGVIK